MRHGTLRFMGYTLHHNPHTLQITNTANVSQYNIPQSLAITQNTGNSPIVVKGDGVFYGDNAFEQYMKLKSLGEKCKAGVLSVSDLNPFFAYLSQLKLNCTPLDDYVEYSFTFIQAPNHAYKENSTAPTQYTVENEDLWDISYRLGISIETLIALNPQLKNTTDIKEGDVITINDI